MEKREYCAEVNCPFYWSTCIGNEQCKKTGFNSEKLVSKSLQSCSKTTINRIAVVDTN